MAICDWCNREMTTARSCTVADLHLDGVSVPMVPWGREPGWRATSRCHDCGVLPRQLHHLGCDVQRCPLCGDQMMSCECRFDEDGSDEEDLGVDANGCLTERIVVGGQEVIVHYDADVPEKDLTVVHGIPCTTALRTVIDIATGIDDEHLARIVSDCLGRGLFTLEEAWGRLEEADMVERPGALRVRAVLPPLAAA
jgi:hypothetical protein